MAERTLSGSIVEASENNKCKLRPKKFLPESFPSFRQTQDGREMFAVLSRSIPSRAFVQSVRCMSKISPNGPSAAKGKLPERPSEPETPAEPIFRSTPTEPLSASLPSLDVSPEEPGGPQRTGAKSSKGSLSSSERKRRFMGRVSLAVLALGFGLNAVYMGREWEEDELKAKKMVCHMQRRMAYTNPRSENRRRSFDTVGTNQGEVY